MWFEGDFSSQNWTNSDGWPGNLAAQAEMLHTLVWSAFPGSHTAFARLDLFAERGWANDAALPSDEPFSILGATADEWGEVASSKSDHTVMNDETIVVTGKRTIRLDLVNWWDAGPNDLFWTVHREGGLDGGFEPEPPADEDALDILINFDRELTESETQALEEFQAAIEELTAAINSLADNAEVRLPNGAYTSGAALKALWAQTDFVIEDNFLYENGTRGGEARMSNGPTISFNIQYLDAYNNLYGGLNYLIGHGFRPSHPIRNTILLRSIDSE